MPIEEKGFRGISINATVFNAVEEFIQENKRYRSVTEFIVEAVRLRLEEMKKGV